MKVLITGAAGALGYAVTRGLAERGYETNGFDRKPSPLPYPHQVGDLMDVSALREACRGTDAVVHLAAVPDRDHFAEQLVPNNIVGAHNALEATRLEGIKRFVYASSCRVVGGLDWTGSKIGLEDGLVPGDHYGLTKATGELMGRMYSDRFGLSVTCARLGWFVRNLQEAEHMPNVESGTRIYLSHQDAVEFFDLALKCVAPPKYCAVFVTSRNADEALFDLEPTRELFGFEPKDSWPEGSSWSEELQFPSPNFAPSLLPDSS